MSRPTILERAFDLARTGNYTRIGAIRKILEAEGYSANQLAGPSLLTQIRMLCQKHNKSAPRDRARLPGKRRDKKRLDYFRKLTSP